MAKICSRERLVTATAWLGFAMASGVSFLRLLFAAFRVPSIDDVRR
jgi:hypothetical protein